MTTFGIGVLIFIAAVAAWSIWFDEQDRRGQR